MRQLTTYDVTVPKREKIVYRSSSCMEKYCLIVPERKMAYMFKKLEDQELKLRQSLSFKKTKSKNKAGTYFSNWI